MKFRRLYWVAEQIEPQGMSRVTGVYTSIQDLIHKGLHWCNEDAKGSIFRLTLVKPDSFNCPLGVWDSPDFEGLEKGLEQFVETNEYSREECLLLQQELRSFVGGVPAR
jgi:hypothetical protein